MSTPARTIEIDFYNDRCVCNKLDENGDEVLDENGKPIPEDWEKCRDCGEQAQNDIQDWLFEEWFERNGFKLADASELSFKVNASGMNWTNDSGRGRIPATYKAMLDLLNIDTDWHLKFILEGNDLRVIRSSHDELGARFEFEIV